MAARSAAAAQEQRASAAPQTQGRPLGAAAADAGRTSTKDVTTLAVSSAVRFRPETVAVVDGRVRFSFSADGPCDVAVGVAESPSRKADVGGVVSFPAPASPASATGPTGGHEHAFESTETVPFAAVAAVAVTITCGTQVHSFVVALNPTRLLSRRFRLGDRVVDVHDMFGLAQRGECVVCLSDVADTSVLPCRHVCLCRSCADAFAFVAGIERRCPVCRGAVDSFLRVQAAS